MSASSNDTRETVLIDHSLVLPFCMKYHDEPREGFPDDKRFVVARRSIDFFRSHWQPRQRARYADGAFILELMGGIARINDLNEFANWVTRHGEAPKIWKVLLHEAERDLRRDPAFDEAREPARYYQALVIGALAFMIGLDLGDEWEYKWVDLVRLLTKADNIAFTKSLHGVGDRYDFYCKMADEIRANGDVPPGQPIFLDTRDSGWFVESPGGGDSLYRHAFKEYCLIARNCAPATQRPDGRKERNCWDIGSAESDLSASVKQRILWTQCSYPVPRTAEHDNLTILCRDPVPSGAARRHQHHGPRNELSIASWRQGLDPAVSNSRCWLWKDDVPRV